MIKRGGPYLNWNPALNFVLAVIAAEEAIVAARRTGTFRESALNTLDSLPSPIG
ncbi:MAG: hypothetical protein ACE5M4_12035 [Anaerolineales bacterium]